MAEVVHLMPRWTQQDWMSDAACPGQTEHFFPPHGEQAEARGVREARAGAICRTCSVILDCRSYARHHREQGYWGGENDGTPPYRLSAGDRRTFETSTVDRLRLIGVIDAILDTGVDDVVVVIPPHDRALLADVGLPLRTFDRLSDDLISVARDEGLAAVDMSRTEWGHDYFFDPAHLSKRGSSRFTQILAAELDRL